MSEQSATVEEQEKMLAEAEAGGVFTSIKTYFKLSGPGWLQSAITLGGGSLAGALFLGVIGGYSLLWVQLLAMVLGVIMLSAIGYVTLSTGESPFQGIRRHINPVLAWGWVIASLMANMVWVLPQYSLAYGALTQNLFPNLLSRPDSLGNKMFISIVIFVLVTAITLLYGKKGMGIKIYETVLKCLVGLIVLCFIGVVWKLTLSEEGLPWGKIFFGFIPNLSTVFSPADAYQKVLNQISNPTAIAFWTSEILSAQRAQIIAAASAAVGINMTFLLPYSLLAKKWNAKFRKLAIFDLSTGMVIPFVIATACVVIASGSMFHGKPYDGLLVEKDGVLMVTENEKLNAQAGAYHKMLGQRNLRVGESQSTVEEPEKLLAAMLIKRGNSQFAQSLSTLVGPKVAHTVFGLGVLAMALSTISLLMLISGFVFCEVFGFEHGGIQHRLGTLLPITGLLWPFLWSGKSLLYLAIPTSVFGYVLLPVAYLTFFMMMNSRRLLKDKTPTGAARLKWNLLMGCSLAITGISAIYTAWGKSLKLGDTLFPLGKVALIAFALAVVVGHFYIKSKHRSEAT